MVEVKNITKIYGKKKNAFEALKNVSFTLPKGTSAAIIGKSGSGKSTLMHAMSGLDKPQKGEILVDGINILNLKKKDVDKFRSEKIGFVFQSFFVQANESCFDNVSLPLEVAGIGRSKRKKLVREALTEVELSDKVKSRARDLSGGQKQRLAIARAIVGNPEILFADEPTGNLDSVTGGKIEDLLFSYNKAKKVTLIIVTHDAELAEKCDLRIYVKDGAIDRIEGDTEPKVTSKKTPKARLSKRTKSLELTPVEDWIGSDASAKELKEAKL